MRWLGFVLLAGLCLAQPKEGFITVPGGPVWYKILKDGPGVPLLVLHGGPGGTSCGMGPLADLPGRKVIVYDQLGSGRSGRPADPKLWTVERFVEELHAVRNALGLKRLHLMGHSWGATLAAAYVVAKGSNGIESLILASGLISTPDWIRDARHLKKQLPAAMQQAMAKHEAAGTTDDPEYREAEAEYNRRFVRRNGAASRATDCENSIGSQTIYRQMWGPTEFHATGSLKNYDLTPRLSSLRLPVLFVVGEFDEARPETAARYQKLVPGSKLEVIPGAAHALWSDNRKGTLGVLAEWLRGN